MGCQQAAAAAAEEAFKPPRGSMPRTRQPPRLQQLWYLPAVTVGGRCCAAASRLRTAGVCTDAVSSLATVKDSRRQLCNDQPASTSVRSVSGWPDPSMRSKAAAAAAAAAAAGMRPGAPFWNSTRLSPSAVMPARQQQRVQAAASLRAVDKRGGAKWRCSKQPQAAPLIHMQCNVERQHYRRSSAAATGCK